MSVLASIQPQRVDFDTCQLYDWLDGLPMIGVPTLGGTLAGTANAGNGSIAVSSVAASTVYGAYVATVSGISGGLTQVGLSNPLGTPIGFGVVGLPIFAAGLTFQLTQGATSFAVGDSFAIAVTRAPLDLTGLQFDLDARDSIGAPSVALQASSGGAVPTIVNGNAAGTVAMAVPRAVMAQCAAKPLGYPYVITAYDPVTDLKVPAFTGLIHHAANAALIGQY